jgi:hypothetical protein
MIALFNTCACGAFGVVLLYTAGQMEVLAWHITQMIW